MRMRQKVPNATGYKPRRVTRQNVASALQSALSPPPPPPPRKTRAQRQAETARQPRCSLCNNVVGKNEDGTFKRYCGTHEREEAIEAMALRARGAALFAVEEHGALERRLRAIELRLDLLEGNEPL